MFSFLSREIALNRFSPSFPFSTFRTFCNQAASSQNGAVAVDHAGGDKLDSEKANEIVQASKRLEDFQKFPSIGTKTAMKLMNKLRMDGKTNFQSIEDIETALDFSDKKIDAFRRKLGPWLKTVDVSEDGIATLKVFKQTKFTRPTDKIVTEDDLKKQFVINRDDWNSVFSYCFDNHTFSYVILDKNNSRILHSNNKRWMFDGELLQEGLTSKIKNPDINFFQRVVDEATKDIPISLIDSHSNLFLTENMLSLIGNKTNMTSTFLSTSFLVAGLLHSNLRSKLSRPIDGANNVGVVDRQNFYEIERKYVYKFFNLSGRKDTQNLSKRLSIADEVVHEKIFPAVSLKPYELPFVEYDENVQTLLSAWIQALVFVHCNNGGNNSSVDSTLVKKNSPETKAESESKFEESEHVSTVSDENKPTANINVLPIEGEPVEALNNLRFRANLDEADARKKSV